MKISYNWLKWYVPEIPDAEKLRDVFTYHLTEVEGIENKDDGDYILDLKILPNRAHDLLSHQGVARELCGQLGVQFNDPTPKYKVPESKPTNLKIDLQTPLCRRYIGRIIRNVKVGPSQDWVRMHLESIGQRSINNIVDATNITMYDSGQPIHAFDLDKLAGEVIIVRAAGAGEKITLLTGEEKELKDGDLVIADEKNVLAIAGVKGGKFAEVDANTKNILIEVANFDPASVRKTSRRLGVVNDSSKRFENDLSPELGDLAMKEVSGLMVEYGFTDFEEIVDIYPNKQPDRKISFSASFVNKKLGADILADEMENILKNYSFEYERKGEEFEITPPALRLDLVIPEDMVEEIGRIVGYERVKPEIPKIDFEPKENSIYAKISAARAHLLAEGYSEVMTYAFTNKGEREVLASASDKKFLRTNLSDGLKESIKQNGINALLLGHKEIKIFEIGSVFLKDREEIHVAFGNKKEVKEFASPDAFLQTLGSAPENPLAPQPGHSEKHAGSASSSAFKMWSLFPFISRDIAFWAPESTDIEEVKKMIQEKAGELLVRGPDLFDEFKKPASAGGEGRVSYAFRLVFQSPGRTLTDEEVSVYMDKITAAFAGKGFEIR